MLWHSGGVIPAFFMTGAAHNLFVPLALAVGFSMVGSYLLSSTFVRYCRVWMLRDQSNAPQAGKRRPHIEKPTAKASGTNRFVRSAGHEEGGNEHRQNAEHGHEPGQRRLSRGLARGTGQGCVRQQDGCGCSR